METVKLNQEEYNLRAIIVQQIKKVLNTKREAKRRIQSGEAIKQVAKDLDIQFVQPL